MPPKFSLQSVLDYRHMRVESLEIELSELLTAQKQGEAMLEELKLQMSRLFEELQEKQIGEIDLFTVAVLRANIKTTQDRINQVLDALVLLGQKIEAKRQELIVAKQDEEALVILKNKEAERFIAEQKRIDDRMQDEIYISQAYRKRVQGN
ncbi:MAG TPA: flagellar FliJ family protein [Anaerolineaceae bacterium]